ncbi:2326_t:CDS:1, partial [Cetraspora pellucida]
MSSLPTISEINNEHIDPAEQYHDLITISQKHKLSKRQLKLYQ